MKITNPEEIVAHFNKNLAWRGHFDAIMPDGTEEDYDTSIPDFAAKQKWGENLNCEDSNGSDPQKCVLVDGKAKFILSVAERAYSVGMKEVGFEEAEILCTVKEIPEDSESGTASETGIVIESVEILTITGQY